MRLNSVSVILVIFSLASTILAVAENEDAIEKTLFDDEHPNANDTNPHNDDEAIEETSEVKPAAKLGEPDKSDVPALSKVNTDDQSGSSEEESDGPKLPKEMLPPQPKDVAVKRSSSPLNTSVGNEVALVSKNANPQMEFGEEVHVLPAKDVERDFASSAENANETALPDETDMREPRKVPAPLAADAPANDTQLEVTKEIVNESRQPNLLETMPVLMQRSVDNSVPEAAAQTVVEETEEIVMPDLYASDDSIDSSVLEDLRDDLDAAAHAPPEYIVTEELVDPLMGHEKFTIKRPTYREFSDSANVVIEEVKEVIPAGRAKRLVPVDFPAGSQQAFLYAEEESEEPDTRIAAGDGESERLRMLADAIERAVVVDSAQFQPNSRSHSWELETEEERHRQPTQLRGREKSFESQEGREESNTAGKSLQEILGIRPEQGPVMIEPESPPQGFPRPEEDLLSEQPEQTLQKAVVIDYDVEPFPSRVVVESKKLTIIYDDSSEERRFDSSDSDSDTDSDSSSDSDSDIASEETVPVVVEVLPVPLGDGRRIDSNDRPRLESAPLLELEVPSTLPPAAEVMPVASGASSNQFSRFAEVFSNNLVVTLSVSPVMLVLCGVLALTLLLFKLYWVTYSPGRAATALMANKHVPTGLAPVSVVTVDKKPLEP